MRCASLSQTRDIARVETTTLQETTHTTTSRRVAAFHLIIPLISSAQVATSNEVEYKFSNNDDGTYTMWVDGGGKEGYYKIYNMCEDGGSKCWIQFDCLKNDKEYSDDC